MLRTEAMVGALVKGVEIRVPGGWLYAPNSVSCGLVAGGAERR